MRRCLVALSAALAGLVLVPVGAGAAPDPGNYFNGQAIAGPAADIQSLGGLDIARDGTGGLVYVRGDHIYVSRLQGSWQAPERIDATIGTASSQPAIAAADGGRLIVAFSSGGTVYTVVRPATGQPFTAPQPVASAAGDPDVDLSVNGVAYVSFRMAGGGGNDVRVARKERDSTQFNIVPGIVDIDPGHEAGTGAGRSRIAVAADGVALVVWGEAGRVYARRVFENRLSQAPQDLPPLSFEGHAGGSADLPDVAIEDDSSFAWVVFRQTFENGAGGTNTRAIARRLLGSQFEAPQAVDGMAFPLPDSVGPPRVAMSGKGAGYAAGATTATAFGSVLKDDNFAPGVPLGTGPANAVLPVAAADESGDGVIAWQAGDGTIHARGYDNVPTSRRPQAPLAEVSLALPNGGPTDAARGLEIGSDRVGDVAIGFVQGTPAARSIVVATFDRRPGTFRLNSRSTVWRNVARTPLRWSAAFDLWGPITYTVQVDGRNVAQTTNTAIALPGLRDGIHRWRVIATDPRGQTVGSARRTVRTDARPPRATISVSGAQRRNRPVRIRVRASDAPPRGRRASGIRRVSVAFGDGARTTSTRTAHRYGRAGRYTIRATVRDRANNVTIVRKRIRIR